VLGFLTGLYPVGFEGRIHYIMHCDLCVKDGHMGMTLKYVALYEKVSLYDGFNPGPKT